MVSMSGINKKDLKKKLIKTRRNGCQNDSSEAVDLLYCLGIDYLGDKVRKTPEQIEALLIKLVDQFIPNNSDKDILLMAFCLLRGMRRFQA
jgi:hypothetical protein